ncbi:MAG: TfoX/Sxy family protein [Aureispira sp.]|nr:TfoX/Sxy family protein [Aureispira sp.]
MAYNEELAGRVRDILEGKEHFTEKKMFGGLSFLYKKKMTVGIIEDRLVARVVEKKCPNLLAKSFIDPMDFTGKPMKEFLFVGKEGFETDEQIQEWIDLGVEHAKYKLKE